MTLFQASKKLPCGHELGFVEWPGEGEPPTLAHQKVPGTIEALNDLFEAGSFKLPTRILEVGVARGGGLAMWADAFGAHIVGITEDLSQLSEVFWGHLKELEGLIHVVEIKMPDTLALSLGTFDLIVDDASHDHETIEGNLRLLWPILRPGGLYLVDDWRTDAGRPEELAGKLARRMIGYWPDESGPDDAPLKVVMYRNLVAIFKR
jgi:SAM-dependent methyltransferase